MSTKKKKKPKKRAPKLTDPVEAWALAITGPMMNDGVPILWNQRPEGFGEWKPIRVRVVPIRGGRGRG